MLRATAHIFFAQGVHFLANSGGAAGDPRLKKVFLRYEEPLPIRRIRLLILQQIFLGETRHLPGEVLQATDLARVNTRRRESASIEFILRNPVKECFDLLPLPRTPLCMRQRLYSPAEVAMFRGRICHRHFLFVVTTSVASAYSSSYLDKYP